VYAALRSPLARDYPDLHLFPVLFGLRVRGIGGLRVADASVMPVIPDAHLTARALAIAEKAADLISSRP